MADDKTLTPEENETVIDKLLELFQSNEVSIDYGNDPQGWVEENLPEGTEAADVARCMPEVTERLGGPYQANAARYNATHGAQAQAATQTVVNEISYTYNTVYQQNTFNYVEGDAQITNINGDGNHVNQTDIDVEFDVDVDQYEDGHEDVDEEYEGEEEPLDGHDDAELPPEHEDAEGEEPWGEEEDPMAQDDGWEEPVDEPAEDPMGGHENPFDPGTVDPAPEAEAADPAAAL